MTSFGYEPVSFEDIPGWRDDVLVRPLVAFANSLAALKRDVAQEVEDGGALGLYRAAEYAAGICETGLSQDAARSFFETAFIAHRVIHDEADGLLTGYFEPTLRGSRKKSNRYSVPLYRRPDDLVDVIGDVLRASGADGLTHARKTEQGLAPFPVRSEIERGALAGCDLELVYLEDPVDTFVLHVQGSGVIELDDGSRIRVGYDGKNGHPYSSIAKHLVACGEMSADEATLASLESWLRQDPERGQRTMWRNKSFIFFKEIGPADKVQPLGVKQTPLMAGRSLAVDARYHRIGLPVFVASPTLHHASDDECIGESAGFFRLMVAHDVGSAIRGPERGDIFFGSGQEAGRLAGITKHRGNLFVLLPSDRTA